MSTIRQRLVFILIHSCFDDFLRYTVCYSKYQPGMKKKIVVVSCLPRTLMMRVKDIHSRAIEACEET